jgi:hypothetical protein
METTYNKLTPNAEAFFASLKNYLDLPLYYFGSIQRPDYFFGGSDIDVDIFTPHPKSTIIQLSNFLHTSPDEFKRMVWKVGGPTGVVAHGHKFMYKDPARSLIVEFSIYDEKYKAAVLAEHRYKMTLPFYVTFLLIFLKMFYYGLGLLPDQLYTVLKRLILNTMVNAEEEHFVIV